MSFHHSLHMDPKLSFDSQNQFSYVRSILLFLFPRLGHYHYHSSKNYRPPFHKIHDTRHCPAQTNIPQHSCVIVARCVRGCIPWSMFHGPKKILKWLSIYAYPSARIEVAQRQVAKRSPILSHPTIPPFLRRLNNLNARRSSMRRNKTVVGIQHTPEQHQKWFLRHASMAFFDLCQRSMRGCVLLVYDSWCHHCHPRHPMYSQFLETLWCSPRTTKKREQVVHPVFLNHARQNWIAHCCCCRSSTMEDLVLCCCSCQPTRFRTIDLFVKFCPLLRFHQSIEICRDDCRKAQ